MRWPPSISSRAPSAACNCPTTTPVERAVSHCCATLQAESLVEQIRQTRDLLEPGPVGIVGFSVGGFMALVAATQLGQFVVGLGVVELWVAVLGWPQALAVLASVAVCVPLTYAVHRWVFRPERGANHA